MPTGTSGERENWRSLHRLLEWYATKCTPTRWLPAGAWVAIRGLALLAVVSGLYSLSVPSSAWWWFLWLISVWLIADIVLANTAITFVTRHPENPLRSVVLTLTAFFSLVPGWAALVSLCADRFSPPLTAWSSLRLAVSVFLGVDFETPQRVGHLAGLFIVVGHLLQFVFLVVIVSVVVGWAPPSEDTN